MIIRYNSSCNDIISITIFKGNRGYIFQVDKNYNLEIAKGQISFQRNIPYLSNSKPQDNEIVFAPPIVIKKKLTKEEQENIKQLLDLSIPELENASKYSIKQQSYALMYIDIKGKNFILHMKNNSTLLSSSEVKYSNVQSLYSYILDLSSIPVDLNLKNFLNVDFNIFYE